MKSALDVLYAVIGGSFALPTEFILMDTSKDAQVQRQDTEQPLVYLDAVDVKVYLSGGAATASCGSMCLFL